MITTGRLVGGTIDDAGGLTTTGFTTDLNSITVDWGSTGQVGSVSVIERNTCTSSNEITVDVNINSIAPGKHFWKYPGSRKLNRSSIFSNK